MKKLVLHVGPGKCGSSTIQQFLGSYKRPCEEKTCYRLIGSQHVAALDCVEPSNQLLDSLQSQIRKDLRRSDVLILSHEAFFQAPNAVKHICSIANDLVSEILIIGYSRRQSGFIVSAYSQWFFRSSNRIGEIDKIIDDLGLDRVLFNGLEKLIIAAIMDDFYSARQPSSEVNVMDWYHSYERILESVNEFDVQINCGVLPKRNANISLLEDFCNKSGLTLREKAKNATQESANLSFDQDIVEAISHAVSSGCEMIGEHENNDLLEFLSSKVRSRDKYDSDFLSKLKAYVDSFFWESNKKLSETYNLDQAYFEPAEIIDKDEIREIIIQESAKREKNKSEIIRNYQVLSARMIELSIRLAKDGCVLF